MIDDGPDVAVNVGSKGARIKAIEEGCEVRCDIDKVKKRVSVRGKATACEKALEEFNTVLGEEGHPAVTYLAPRPPSPEPEEEKDDVVEEEAIHAVPRGPRVIPGSAPTATNVVAAVVGKQLSKSAQRRLRRKLASVEEPDHEDGAGNDEADHEHAEATVPVVTTPSPPAPPVAEPATVKQASPSIPENVAPTPVQIAAAVRAAPVNVPTPVVVVPTPVAPVAAPVKMEPIASLKTPSVSTPSPLPPVASAPAPALKAAAPAPIPASIEPIGGGILSRGVPAKPSALPAAPGLPAPSSNYKQSDLLALLLGDEPVANSTMAAKPANYAPYMQFGGQQPTFSGASTLLGNASNSTVPPINPRSLPPPGLGDSTGKNPSPNYYKSKSGLTVRL